jgi:hypothetical protein
MCCVVCSILAQLISRSSHGMISNKVRVRDSAWPATCIYTLRSGASEFGWGIRTGPRKRSEIHNWHRKWAPQRESEQDPRMLCMTKYGSRFGSHNGSRTDPSPKIRYRYCTKRQERPPRTILFAMRRGIAPPW